MDKTTKLIRWQRITIGVLAGATLFSMWQAHLYQMARVDDWQAIEHLRDRLADALSSQRQKRLESRLEDRNRITSLELQVKSDQEMIATLGKGSVIGASSHNRQDIVNSLAVNQMLIESVEREEAAQRVIHDLDVRMKKYETKYGPIEPRRGEGVYIGKTITRGLSKGLPSR